MRIAVLGNSHLAAIRDGWEQVRDAHPGVTLDFFGAAQRDLRPLRIDGAGIVPRSEEARASFRMTSGGPDRIAFAGVGAVLIVGLAFAFRQVLELYPGHGTWRMSAAPGRVMISETLFRRSLAARLSATFAAETAARIRAAGGTPVFLMPQPNYAEGFPAGGPSPATGVIGPDRQALMSALDAGDGAALEATWREAAVTSAEAAGATLLPVPDDMLRQGCLLAAEWSEGSRPLHAAQGPAHRADDHWHMNAAYGARMLTMHLPSIARPERPARPQGFLSRLLRKTPAS